MASIFVVLGSMIGFVAALVGWIALDFSLFTGLAIWIGSGPLAALVAIVAGTPTRESSESTADRTMAEA